MLERYFVKTLSFPTSKVVNLSSLRFLRKTISIGYDFIGFKILPFKSVFGLTTLEIENPSVQTEFAVAKEQRMLPFEKSSSIKEDEEKMFCILPNTLIFIKEIIRTQRRFHSG